jgi:hypothetical protein
MADRGSIPAGGKKAEEPKGWRSMKESIKSLWQFALSNRVIPTTGWTATPGGLLPPTQKPVVRKQFELYVTKASGDWQVFIEPGRILGHQSKTRAAREYTLDLDPPPGNFLNFSGTKSVMVTVNFEYDGTYWLVTDEFLTVDIVDHLDIPDDEIPEITSYDEEDPPVAVVHLMLGSVVEDGSAGWIEDRDGNKGVQDIIGTIRLALDANPHPSGSGSGGPVPTYWTPCYQFSGSRVTGFEYVRGMPGVPTPSGGGTTYWKVRTPVDSPPEWTPEPLTRLEPVITTGSGELRSASHHENVFLCDANTGEVTIQIGPDLQGYPIIAKKTDGSANEVIIAPSGSGTVDGAADYRLTAQYETAMFASDEFGNVHILASHLA